MSRSTLTTMAPAGRLTTVLADVLGTDWARLTSDWPVVFGNEAVDRQLTVYPDRLNHRLVFISTPQACDDFAQQRFAKYTPDLTGHDSIDSWLADGDLDTVADALAIILERLVEQPLPERATHNDPLQTEREHLAEQATKLAAHASRFAAGLIWGQPVTDGAQRLATLALNLAHTATRVDELRGYPQRHR
ncbi:hypothetical protein OG422_31270 (plasmid) [Streptomyces sp. NBC_01525]|uniref:hypothetical protein n=1 Tax=Streptomyces sp. NBC_01525 TaxID=2903893 RepID=UPI0038705760